MFRFSLRAMLTRKRPRRTGRLVLKAIVPTQALEDRLARSYMAIIRHWARGQRQIAAAYGAVRRDWDQPSITVDSEATPVTRLNGILEALGDEAERLVMQLQADLSDWTFYVETWHEARWQGTLQPHNVDLRTWIGPADVGGTLETQLRQNTSLIRNVSETLRRRTDQIIFSAFQQRKPARVVARELAEATGLERKRALRIVSDQTQKLSSLLDEERMRQAGLDEFEWMHSGKVHFRPHHKARDGQVFKWGDIPADDMPGIPPWCGCKKRAVVRFD